MTSKFKVGDRIRIYGTDGNMNPVSGVSVIEKILDNGMFYVEKNETVHNPTKNIDLMMPFPKQCRRLKVKRKPSFWINETGIINYTYFDNLLIQYQIKNPGPGWVRMVKAKRQ